MRKLRRWLLNTLTVLSLMLCVATAGLWVQSHVRPGMLTFDTAEVRVTAVDRQKHPEYQDAIWRSRSWAWGSYGGQLVMMSALAWSDQAEHRMKGEWEWTDLGQIFHNAAAFRWGRVGYEHSSTGVVIGLPHWCTLLASAVLPLVRILQYMRRRRFRQPGHCPACTYDLTGNVSGVCPECGSPVPACTARVARSQTATPTRKQNPLGHSPPPAIG